MATKKTLSDNNRLARLSAQVFDELETGILANRIKPGDNLVELKISSELGVSRTPIREAIRMLEKKGLAKVVPNKGAVVIGVSEKDLKDIYTIRMYIEGLAGRWAAMKIKDEQVKGLDEFVDLQTYYLMKNTPDKLCDLDSRFHERIYELSDSKPLSNVLSELHHMVWWFRELSFNSEGRAEKSIEEHRAIIRALESHDEDLTEKLMKNHVENAQNNLLDIFHQNSLG